MIRQLRPSLIAAIAAFAFGGGVSAAAANHYHVCCGATATGHALVHGGSQSDNVWHGRSTANGYFDTRYCAAGSDASGLKGSSTGGANTTCQIQVAGNQFISGDNEYCHSWGFEDKGTFDNGHYHSHHSTCGGV